MDGRRGVAVTGTNGKTTTTSMLTVAVQHCGADPSFAIGGDLGESGSNAHHGTGSLFIAEADESDGSFLLLSPDAAVVTNIEVDHLDQHGTPEAYAKAFDDFLGRIRPPGILVCCADDPGSRRLAELARPLIASVRTYGESADADLRLTDISVTPTGTTYTAIHDGGSPMPVALSVAGRHMALNSAAALLTGLELGLPVDRLIDGLAGYGGVRRRFEHKGTVAGVRVYDDYAHHPSKVAAQLKAARVVAEGGRVIVAFQPHLYSRTQAFATEFGQALGLADEVVVMEVAGVREDPVPGVTGALVADAIPLPAGQVHYEPSWSATAPLVAGLARAGDLVVTMGAGDVTMVGPEVLTALAELSARPRG
jgi:UDP-N-acetylmuramate--alanine ligase